MNNTSLNQLHKEIETARKQSYDPARYEVGDVSVLEGEETGNNLSDYVTMRDEDLTLDRYYTIDGNPAEDIMRSDAFKMPTTIQTVPPMVKVKIEKIFENKPLQYELLGLYYAGGFTQSEISELKGMTQKDVQRSLLRGKKNLKKYLTDAEYDSIRWLLRDLKPLPILAQYQIEMGMK